MVVANVVVPVTTNELVVVASTKIADVAEIVEAVKLLFIITDPLKIDDPLKMVSVSVVEERIKLFPVPELNVPPVIAVLFKLAVFTGLEKNGKNVACWLLPLTPSLPLVPSRPLEPSSPLGPATGIYFVMYTVVVVEKNKFVTDDVANEAPEELADEVLGIKPSPFFSDSFFSDTANKPEATIS